MALTHPCRFQRLRRTLAETDKEVSSYRSLFDEFLGTPAEEWEPLVGLRRAALVPAFFEYLQVRISSLDAETMGEQREGAPSSRLLLQRVQAEPLSRSRVLQSLPPRQLACWRSLRCTTPP